GFKKTNTNENITFNVGQRIFVFVAIALLAAIAVLMLGDNPLNKSHAQRIDYAALHKDFANECGSCHAIYPPFLLPKHSWALMMNDLENHFGDDASIDSLLNAEILAFLEKYSAESFDTKVSRNIIEKETDSANIAITKNPYWIELHAHIAEDVFAQPSVKTKANCFACHKDLEHGILTLTD
ncbi:MAG: diheme cytochrome c, partial [Helicobacter sp.]|nr:diheme cytochrome c [Helicobacter sp.]